MPLNALNQATQQLIPASHLAPARVLVGIAAILKSAMLIGAARDVFSPGGINFPWFSFLPVPSVTAVWAVLAVWVAAAIAFTIGRQARMAGVVLSVCIAIVMFSDRHLYSNHLYLLLLLVALLTAAQLRSQRASDASDNNRARALTPLWPLMLIRVQISVVYFYAAITKLNNDWLIGESVGSSLMGTAPGQLFISLVGRPGAIAVAAATIVLELWLSFALWTESRVRVAIVLGVLFHVGIVIMMLPRSDLVVFTLLMVAGYTAFWPDEVRGWRISDKVEQKRVAGLPS